MLIPQDFIDDVLDRVSLPDLIAEAIPLRQNGNNYTGLCPFHTERTPSFSVAADKGFYHCFGCKESGNAVSFMMKYHGRTFPEAIAELAARVGLELRREALSPEQARQRQEIKTAKERALAALDFAAKTFNRWLHEANDSQPRDYLKGRGISSQDADNFMIGWAPPGWTNFGDYALKRGLKAEDLIAAGLIYRRDDGSHNDRFRQRIMFPITNSRGAVIAFSGRTLDPEERAKYINTSETPWYTKGKELFGFTQARRGINVARRAILVEGNFDALSLHAQGIDNTLALLGTALTDAQAKTLSVIADEVCLFFDGDSAGDVAAERALERLHSFGLTRVTKVRVPQGKDPHDLLSSLGADAVKQLIDQAPPLLPELIDRWVVPAATSTDPADRGRALAAASAWIAQLPQGEQLGYTQDLNRRLGIDLAVINREVEAARGNKRADGEAQRGASPSHNSSDTRHLKDPSTDPQPIESDPIELTNNERWLLKLVWLDPRRLEIIFDKKLELNALLNPKVEELLSCALALHRQGQRAPLKGAVNRANNSAITAAAGGALFEIGDLSSEQADQAWDEITANMRNEWVDTYRSKLSLALSAAVGRQDDLQVAAIEAEIGKINYWSAKA